jgi:hypothetical protein
MNLFLMTLKMLAEEFERSLQHFTRSRAKRRINSAVEMMGGV